MKRFIRNIVDMLALSVYAEIEGTDMLRENVRKEKIVLRRQAQAVCVAR
jgi:hypothetical protein